MRLPTRVWVGLVTLTYCVWASATQVRHFVLTPSAGLVWLWVAPPVACILVVLGLMGEKGAAASRPQKELASWRELNPLVLVLQYGGLLLMSWRALWMFFSWDGMFYFPAWCALALTLYRWHPRWVPCA